MSRENACCGSMETILHIRTLYEKKLEAQKKLQETYRREIIDQMIRDHHLGRGMKFEDIRQKRMDDLAIAEREFNNFMQEVLQSDVSTPKHVEKNSSLIPMCCHDRLTVKGIERGSKCYCPVKNGKRK